MGWATGAWAEGAWAGTAWAVQSAPVEVPNVVGETQASATSTLEGDGFVVSVLEAYSDSVALGLVISQEPEGGEQANSGSTVVITVSLGVQPASKGAGRKRRRYVVEVDGQTFEVASVAEAQAVLDQARALAEAHAQSQVQRSVKRARRRGKALRELTLELPSIETQSLVLEPLIAQAQADIRAIYERIARDAEIRELMRIKLVEEDEEDAIVTLLLH